MTNDRYERLQVFKHDARKQSLQNNHNIKRIDGLWITVVIRQNKYSVLFLNVP